MLKRALIKAVAIACVSIWQYHIVIWVIDVPDSLRLHLEHDHHEAAHEEAAVGLLIIGIIAVVVKLHILEVWIH
jgi:hypothetical protein